MPDTMLGQREGLFRLPLAPPVRGNMERNSVDPRIEAAVALECAEFRVGLNHGVLNDVLRFVGLAHQMGHAGEKPILKAAHQLTERVVVPLLGVSDQELLGFHVVYRQLVIAARLPGRRIRPRLMAK